MRGAQARINDYTCTELITRSISDGTPLRVRTLDRFRLQVAVIGGRERFSWPGAAFERDDPRDIVGGGLTGVGDFAGFSRSVFSSDGTDFTTGEEEVRDQKPTIRYDYTVPRKASIYRLGSGTESAVVDYGGSFWVDPLTERVVALKVEVDQRRNNIPAALDMFDVKTMLEFNAVRPVGEELPFPTSSTLTVVHFRNSLVTSNHIEFTGCRQYSAESSIQFGVPDAVKPVAPAAKPAGELPDGLDLEVELDAPVRGATAAAGDAVTATLRRPVRAGTFRLPKGARLLGRILSVETDMDKNATHVRLGFSRLENADRSFPFRARFVTSETAPGVEHGGGWPAKWIDLREIQDASASEWVTRMDFRLMGKEAQLPKGFRMEWLTSPAQNPRR